MAQCGCQASRHTPACPRRDLQRHRPLAQQSRDQEAEWEAVGSEERTRLATRVATRKEGESRAAASASRDVPEAKKMTSMPRGDRRPGCERFKGVFPGGRG